MDFIPHISFFFTILRCNNQVWDLKQRYVLPPQCAHFLTLKKPNMQKKSISNIKALFIGCACSALVIACNNATDTGENNAGEKDNKEMKMAEAVISGTKED